MKIHFILTLLIFLTACQSVAHDKSSVFQKKSLSQQVENSCFSVDEGSFLVNVSVPRVPTVLWEGKWMQNFSQLKTQLLDATGGVIELNLLSEIMDKFGAQGMRSAMCGQTAFSPILKLDGYKIKVKSKINLFQTHDNQTILETTSEFYYGLFAKKHQNTLFWRGRIQGENVIPQFIRFGAGDEFLTFDFIDYE